MDENKIIGEQPNMDNVTSSTSVENFGNGSQDVPSGSLLGKFKDVESLMNAYETLQSEFTKKCQAYSELKKSQSESTNDNVKTPFFERENWQSMVDSFYGVHPSAKAFSNEIADVLSDDKFEFYDKNPLECAYNVVLEKENQKLTSSINDEEKVLGLISPKMKEKIVSEYIGQLKNAPSLILSNGGSNVIASSKKPLSMREAGEMAKKLFK